MRTFLGAMGVGLALFVGTESWAATVEPVQGDLSVNQGQGFQRVDSRVDANVGDSVMVSPGGAATVVYPDGCQVSVQPGAITSIAPLSPCASGSLAQDQPVLSKEVPIVGAPIGAPIGAPAPWSAGDPALWVAGIGVAAGAGVIIYEAVRPRPKPASP